MVAGDKSGVSEKRFYKTLIAKADKRYRANFDGWAAARKEKKWWDAGLTKVVAALPAERRAHVDARSEELKAEVEGLRALRRAAGKAQAEIALTLNIKQPSVSKIEKQADMYLSTLRTYVEAIGGQLELIVRFPSRAPLRIERLGDVAVSPPAPVRRTRVSASGQTPRAKAAPAEWLAVSAQD